MAYIKSITVNGTNYPLMAIAAAGQDIKLDAGTGGSDYIDARLGAAGAVTMMVATLNRMFGTSLSNGGYTSSGYHTVKNVPVLSLSL